MNEKLVKVKNIAKSTLPVNFAKMEVDEKGRPLKHKNNWRHFEVGEEAELIKEEAEQFERALQKTLNKEKGINEIE